jgi:hypothetical protein
VTPYYNVERWLRGAWHVVAGGTNQAQVAAEYQRLAGLNPQWTMRLVSVDLYQRGADQGPVQ